jgi:hypothetical protein
MLGIFRAAKVVATEGRAPPSALAGLFAGALASGFAAVMLAVLVAVIREEKLAATAALTSLGPQTHRWSKRPRCRRKEKPRPEGKKNQGGRRKKHLQAKLWKKIHRKKIQFQTGAINAFSFRR